MHELNEEKTDVSKYSIYEKLERVFDHFSKYNMKILLGDFNAQLGREDILKPTARNENLHQDCNDNGARIVNFTTSDNLIITNKLFQHRNIHKYTSTSTVGETRLITY